MNPFFRLEQSSKQGLWAWLLRNTGVESWFQRPLTADHAEQEERVFLMLALPDATPPHTELLADVLREHQPHIEAGGGRLSSPQNGRLLLSWPVAIGCHRAQAVATYFQLRDALSRRADSLNLHGAATIAQVAPGPTSHYSRLATKHVAGLLQECQRQGSGLLVSAVLRHQLDALPTLQYTLDIAVKVAEHRYPATVYHVATTPTA